jgi:hypothetical protein
LNKDFNIDLAFVCGNESRVNLEWGWVESMVSDNYDFCIFNILKYLFKDAKGIQFLPCEPCESVFKIYNQNILLLHGNSIRGNNVEKCVQQIIGKYAAKNIILDYVIFGHLHSARIGDNYARSSSMCGSNDYADKGLHLTGRASQNIYIFHENGNRDGIKIDLQNTNNIGYNIDSSLFSYNTKSVEKLFKKNQIIEIK